MPSNASRVQPLLERRPRVDGRFGRCKGCGAMKVFCGRCASVGARCESCAACHRRGEHRMANQEYGRSELGRASGKKRQARFRARHRGDRGGVTDAFSTEESRSSTTSLASRSVVEAALPEDLPPHDTALPSLPRALPPLGASPLRASRPPLGVVRCARCRCVLSGRVRPSERSPASRRRRRPRPPSHTRAP